ncbi:hypothetical protein V8D89_015663 [Ganoderma adspersum]
MRVIDTETGEFVEFVDSSAAPLYAILSHTWEQAPKQEQSYQDVVKIQKKRGVHSHQLSPALPAPYLPLTSNGHRSIWDFDSGLSDKIRRACEIARRDGYHYIWIDSCCIDKTSSSELSEAINSMFNWYRDGQVCYAFLSDVPSHDDIEIEHAGFRRSRWFTRAWTLQELIAPRVVIFFSQEWEPLGTKDALADVVEDITHIDRAILTHKKGLAEESVAERMRWAAKREATRVEDEAYSLLGIFGITMPTLYGEGAYSFRRLQEEILQRIPDQSLFAWGSLCLPIPQEPGQIIINPHANSNASDGSLLALSPHLFDLSCGRIICASASADFEVLKLPVEEYTHTPYGICTRLCLLPLNALNEELSVTGFDGVGFGGWYLAILGCQYFGHSEDGRGRILSRLCYLTHPKPDVEFLHVPDSIYLPSSGYSGRVAFTVPLDALVDTEALQLHTKVVYLPYPKLSSPSPGRRLYEDHTECRLSLSTRARAALRPYGYTISDVRPTEHATNSHSLVLFNSSFNIHIHYRHILFPPDSMVIEARIWILPPDSNEDTIQSNPPYASAMWSDNRPWNISLPPRSVHLVTSSGDEVTLRLGVGLAAPSHYNVYVEVETDALDTRPTSQDMPIRAVSERGRPTMWMPHTDLKFTLLGSVRKALENQGYSVRVEGPNPNHGSSHSCSLNIYNAASASTIVIEYFHLLRETVASDQVLVVAACVTLKSSSNSASHTDSETNRDGPYVVVWTDGHSRSWRWCQERKEVRLVVSTSGDSLTLRLGLDLALQSEYYLLVDVEHGGGSLQSSPSRRAELDDRREPA